MKWFLFFWAAPLALLGGWYGLSYYDMNFGTFILSRHAHDLVFAIYGKILGLDPKAVPPLIARALVLDSLFVFALMTFRRRAKILAWWKDRRTVETVKPQPALVRDDSLSRAP
jgi:hypothetical protein